VHVMTRETTATIKRAITRQHHNCQTNNPTMDRPSVEQALTGLIPALNGPLPAELVELALSLLTRSRSVAHSLKSDEEIARPYACAQLACERYFGSQPFKVPHI
jgi:origin recognition complex subunit 6